jgi:hypothetical protein
MEAYKIDNFRKTHTEPFPTYRSPTEAEAAALEEFYLQIFGTTGPTLCGLLAVVERVLELDASNEGFDLSKALPRSYARFDAEVAVKWLDTFDTVDIFHFQTLVKYFDDIWYPGTDDIEIIDLDCKWLIAVEHGGYVYRWPA